jgi:hypothetical protein
MKLSITVLTLKVAPKAKIPMSEDDMLTRLYARLNGSFLTTSHYPGRAVMYSSGNESLTVQEDEIEYEYTGEPKEDYFVRRAEELIGTVCEVCGVKCDGDSDLSLRLRYALTLDKTPDAAALVSFNRNNPLGMKPELAAAALLYDGEQIRVMIDGSDDEHYRLILFVSGKRLELERKLAVLSSSAAAVSQYVASCHGNEGAEQ